MRFQNIILAVVLACLTTAALAQSNAEKTAEKPKNQVDLLITFNKNVYGRTKNNLLRSAEKMSEENYGFKPVDSVRSFGQIIGHVADAQYLFCSIVLGEKNPGLKIEESKTSKADLIAALKEAFGYCDRAYDSLTDASATQMVPLFGNDAPKLGVLSVNNMHNMEHYGNLVTYMRMKNIVPPSSEQQNQLPPKK